MRHHLQLTEKELRLPEWLQTYTGYGDDHGNSKITERQWAKQRRQWLGEVVPKRVHTVVTETLLTDAILFVENYLHGDRSNNMEDHADQLLKKLHRIRAELSTANENRRANIAKARAARGASKQGRKPLPYKVTDGSGEAQIVYGVDKVAELTGSTPSSVSAQLSYGAGKAWLGRRDPEHSWTVERLPKDFGTEPA